MIRTLGESGGHGMVEIAGTPDQLAREAVRLVQVVYNSLHVQNTAAGETFRRAFIAQYEKGTLWQSPRRDRRSRKE